MGLSAAAARSIKTNGFSNQRCWSRCCIATPPGQESACSYLASYCLLLRHDVRVILQHAKFELLFDAGIYALSTVC